MSLLKDVPYSGSKEEEEKGISTNPFVLGDQQCPLCSKISKDVGKGDGSLTFLPLTGKWYWICYPCAEWSVLMDL